MLKACLIASAVAILLGGAAAAQSMPPPPSASEAPPRAAKPGVKPKPQAKRRASDATPTRTRAERASQGTAAPLKPFDRRDIAEPETERRFQPQLTPSGGIGMGGRF